jgi:MoxR-like ATPase
MTSRAGTATAEAPTFSESEVGGLLAKVASLRAEIGRVIVGQAATIEQLLMAFLAGGHCLLEGVPGLAKTLMIRTLAEAVHVSFRRIQFTPDLMPTDILGTEVLEEDHATGRRFFKFNRGPVFANIVLADEINRTPPKTQAALLEAMQEYAVTYGGTTYPLERPFFVLATQNPIEQAGTYPLPEAQLDRFLLYVRVGYPGDEEELDILRRTTGGEDVTARPVVEAREILRIQQLARSVRASEAMLAHAARLARESRPEQTRLTFIRDWVRWGAGPRAGQALVLSAKARALLQGRYAVTLDDLRAVAPPVLRHRILVNFRAEADGITPDQVTQRLLEETPEPRSPLG